MEKIITRLEASSQQLKYYFTGKPCKNGHVELRNTKSSRCKECDRIYSEKFRKEHPNIMQQWRKNNSNYASQKYHENKEQRKKQTKEWYENNREHCLQRNKKWYNSPENQPRIKTQRKQWYIDHPEYDSQYYQENYERFRTVYRPAQKQRVREKQRAKIQQAFQELAQLHQLPEQPTERDFKYWLAGQIISRTGWFVYKEIWLDNLRTSKIDLLIPEAKLGIELKLSNYNWATSVVEAQQTRYQTLLQVQGYTVIVVSLDGSLGIGAQEFLETLKKLS